MNAARVEMRATTPLILGQVLRGGAGGNEVLNVTRATAAQDLQAILEHGVPEVSGS